MIENTLAAPATASVNTLRARNLKIIGVSVQLLDQHKNNVPFTSTGYIGSSLNRGQSASFSVNLETVPGVPIMGVHLDETTNGVLLLKSTKTQSGGLLYRQNLCLRRDREGTTYVDRSSNNIRLVGVTPKGECVLWNIGFVSQAGHIFIVYQKMCDEQAYITSGGSILIPGMQKVKKWQSLGRYLEGVIAEPETIKQMTLPDASRLANPAEQQRVDGQVLFYSLRQQMGAIWTPKGEARVSWEDIKTKRPDRLAYLLPGEIVTYRPGAPRRHTGARETTFMWQAYDVEVVS